MSLLNQVLLDLEKRNATTEPEQYLLNNIKTVYPSKKNTTYLPVALILFTCILLAFTYGFNEKKEQKTPVLNTSQKKITSPTQHQKKSVVKNTRDTDKKTQAKKQDIRTSSRPKPKPQAPEVKKAPILVSDKPKKTAFKTISKTQQAEQLFTTAKLQKNKVEKQKKLELVLTLNPQHINARLLLSNTLLNQGLTNQTEEILDQGLALFPQNMGFINLRSQLLLQNNQPQAALTILQKIDAIYVQNETYLSLLASAYQQNNNNLKSLQTYQKLLKINPQKAEYWLGLAIAMEKQGDTKQALNAYRESLDKNTLKIAIVSYIKQRISILK